MPSRRNQPCLKQTIFFILFLAIVFTEEIELGEKLKLDSTTTVSAILDHPQEFLGKPVQISGTIIDVCPNRGCWIDVSSNRGERYY